MRKNCFLRQILLLILSLIFSSQNCNLVYAKNVIALSLKTTEVIGSVVDKLKNIVVIPNARSLGIKTTVSVQPTKDTLVSAKPVKIDGNYAEDGSLVIDLTKIGTAQ